MAANDAVSMNVAENRQNVPMAIQENRAAVPMTVAEGGGTPGGLNKKADKVTGAAAGNLAGLDSTGNLTDSGKAPEDFLEAPASAGTQGQVLTADGEGGASWQDPTGGDPTEIIDDNAGSGDTDKVWSADKSHSLLTEINSKADEPTGTKTAGKVYGLDSNLNPAWMEVQGGGTVVTDKTLKVEDAPADAKAVGDFNEKVLNTNSIFEIEEATVNGTGDYVYKDYFITNFPKDQNLYLFCDSLTGTTQTSGTLWIDSYNGDTQIHRETGSAGYRMEMLSTYLTNATKLRIRLYAKAGSTIVLDPEGAVYKGVVLYSGNTFVKKLRKNIEIEAVTELEADFSELEAGIGSASVINNGAIKPEKTSFVVVEKSTNIFDKDTMVEVGKWVVNTNGKAEKKSNAYTTNYGAIVLEVDESIGSISLKSSDNYAKVYNYFLTKSDDTILSSATPSPSTPLKNGTTINLVSGTKKVYISVSDYTSVQNFFINEGSTPGSYEPYYNRLIIQNLFLSEANVLNAPDEYTAVVGDTLQIFYKGLLLSADDSVYDVVCRCDIGKAYERFYEVTPVAGDVGNHTLSIELYSLDHSQTYGTKNITLKVVAKASSPGTMKNILYVGDSLAVDGSTPAEFDRRLTGSGGTPTADGLSNISFVGTKTNGTTGYEGNGGWTFNHYNNISKNAANMLITASHSKTSADQHSIYKDTNNVQWKLETIEAGSIKIIRVSASGTLPSTGTLTWVSGGTDHDTITYTASEQASGNPFWDTEQEKVDFGTYATRLGISSIDYVYVLLGWNGGLLPNETTYKATVTTFIGNVLDAFPSCQIVLLGLEVPARDGLAHNYTANDDYSNYFKALKHVFTLNKWYEEIAEANASNVSYVNISGQFDSENNMQTSTRNVNTRNATTETFQSNGVHPATSGYNQIADACYRDFMRKLQQ